MEKNKKGFFRRILSIIVVLLIMIGPAVVVLMIYTNVDESANYIHRVVNVDNNGDALVELELEVDGTDMVLFQYKSSEKAKLPDIKLYDIQAYNEEKGWHTPYQIDNLKKYDYDNKQNAFIFREFSETLRFKGGGSTSSVYKELRIITDKSSQVNRYKIKYLFKDMAIRRDDGLIKSKIYFSDLIRAKESENVKLEIHFPSNFNMLTMSHLGLQGNVWFNNKDRPNAFYYQGGKDTHQRKLIFNSILEENNNGSNNLSKAHEIINKNDVDDVFVTGNFPIEEEINQNANNATSEEPRKDLFKFTVLTLSLIVVIVLIAQKFIHKEIKKLKEN